MSPQEPMVRIEMKLDQVLENQARQDIKIAVHQERIDKLEEGQTRQGGKLWSVLGMVVAAVIGAVVSRLGGGTK